MYNKKKKDNNNKKVVNWAGLTVNLGNTTGVFMYQKWNLIKYIHPRIKTFNFNRVKFFCSSEIKNYCEK